jgi:hypothetical protein
MYTLYTKHTHIFCENCQARKIYLKKIALLNHLQNLFHAKSTGKVDHVLN